jgi:pimeloyl-ACP methyl ester carboxylesterase
MGTVRSADGTTIAFDRLGSGPAIVLVGGAFSYRAFPKMVELAELLATRFTVINYDRRGRGDSDDTAPYAVAREIDDLEALIDVVGGSASVWGWSSGGVLALRAAASGLGIEKVAVYEPPFIVNDSGRIPPKDFAAKLSEMTASGRRGDAVRYYLTRGMGIPRTFVTLMRFTPFWSKLKATALTLPYDWAVLGDTMEGRSLSAKEWESVTAPTLVMTGEKSPPQLRDAAAALANVLPNARHRILAGESHNPSMMALAPELIEFFADVTFAQPLDRYRLDSAAGPSGTADTEEVFPSAKSSR